MGLVLRPLPAAELAHFFSLLSSQPAKSSTDTVLVFFYRYGTDFSREVSFGGIMGISQGHDTASLLVTGQVAQISHRDHGELVWFP